MGSGKLGAKVVPLSTYFKGCCHLVSSASNCLLYFQCGLCTRAKNKAKIRHFGEEGVNVIALTEVIICQFYKKFCVWKGKNWGCFYKYCNCISRQIKETRLFQEQKLKPICQFSFFVQCSLEVTVTLGFCCWFVFASFQTIYLNSHFGRKKLCWQKINYNFL